MPKIELAYPNGKTLLTVSVSPAIGYHVEMALRDRTWVKRMNRKPGQSAIGWLRRVVRQLGDMPTAGGESPGDAGHVAALLLAGAHKHPNAVWNVIYEEVRHDIHD